MRGKSYDSASEIVVCDDSGRLTGLVNIEDLVAASADTAMSEIMDSAPPAVTPGIDQEVVAWQAIRHRETSLAVVNGNGHFRGMIPPRRILEVLLWEYDEDTARLGGFLESSSEAYSASDEPVSRRLAHRLPWLIVGLLGAVLSADLVGLFEGQLQAQVMLAFFLPGVVYLADAVGTQTETLAVRGLSVGIPIERVFRRELITGLLIGTLLGALFFVVVKWRWRQTDVALAVSFSLFLACAIASLVAMVLPLALRHFRQDPAFAAGPLATVIQDLVTVLIFFLVSLFVVGD
jgi:magnesium transporter